MRKLSTTERPIPRNEILVRLGNRGANWDISDDIVASPFSDSSRQWHEPISSSFTFEKEFRFGGNFKCFVPAFSNDKRDTYNRREVRLGKEFDMDSKNLGHSDTGRRKTVSREFTL